MHRTPEQRHAYIVHRWGLAITRLFKAKTKTDKAQAAAWCAVWATATGIRPFPAE